jgi:uncharacterized protein (TIGR02147 family)
MSIFSYIDYFKWLADRLKISGQTYGLKKRLAEAAGCQSSYFSLVVKREAHLTLEQAERLARYWQLSPEESDYLLLLVSFARSGSPELKSFYQTKLNKLKEAHENLSQRIKNVEVFPETEAAIYYSSWQYLAIHILISIPEFQNIRAISERLQLSQESVLHTLQYLQQLGLAELKAGQWKSTRREIHLPRESHFISLHHSHWRRRAVDNAFLNRKDDIHYTGVSSLAAKDIEVLRQMILKFIDDSRKVIGPSQEEEMICLAIDLFKV